MKKTLYRVNENKKIAGVCAGFAEYFDVDVTLIRLGVAAFCLLGGSGVLAYILAAIIMPVKPDYIVWGSRDGKDGADDTSVPN